MFNTVEHSTHVHQATVSETHTHEYLILTEEVLEALNFNLQCALNSLAADNYIRIFFNSVFPNLLIVYLISVKEFSWPNGHKGVPQELYDVTTIFMNGFSHYFNEAGGLLAK